MDSTIIHKERMHYERVTASAKLKKTFKISAKQQKIQNTKERIKVAVNHLSFTAYQGEVFGLLGSMAQARLRHCG